MNKLQGALAGIVLTAVSATCVAAQTPEAITRRATKTVAALYPSVLKRRGIGGTVKLRLVISAGGTVKDVQVVGGNPILADAAAKALKQWVFVPAEKEETVEMSVNFDPNAP
jgi:TonB family protein